MEKHAAQEENRVGVSFIRKTIPSPSAGTAVSPAHAATLARVMGQRLFENVLRGAEEGSGSVQGAGEEMALMKEPVHGENLQRLRAQMQMADPASLQALMTAAYIKASALGSGSAAWKALRPNGFRLSSQAASSGQPDGALSVLMDTSSQENLSSSPEESLGGLSARFESGGAGVEAVGYDPAGGTSYGVYQIASRPGTMARFLDFLARHEPRWAERLRAAGPADTGGTQGAMPRVWKAIAREDPQRFAALQKAFIRETHYEPARQAVLAATGVDLSEASRPVQEVLWSAAVQHGPARAADMFIRALRRQEGRVDVTDETALIHAVYRDRSRLSRFSLGALRDALLRRYQEEKAMALAMLQGSSDSTA